jgi:DNA-binding transcriptional regulator YhcF (GntR family)
LENQGIIETIAGKGCFISANHSPLKKDIRRKMLILEIDQAVVQAHHLQVPRDEFLKLVHERFDVMEEKRQASKAEKAT